ncbi:hypothetical protein [Labilibacter marinus]|uniref:hypothetical protein n=1 Tax=Labilibacter marinus TaxID=1477105 RepID=UPI00094F7636|nr:hypothetical protein [Labilibacter marinus]
MNQKQMNRKHMLDATLNYLNTNNPIWQGIAKIGEVKNKLNSISIAIDAAADNQEVSQVTVGGIKTNLKHTLCQKADIINDLVEVFALMNGNEILASKMTDSASDIFKLKNDDMLRRVKFIIESAIENKDALMQEYGLTEEQIVDIQGDYDHYLTLHGQPREFQIQSGMATQSLDELFEESSKILSGQLDNLIKIFKRRNATFYAGYQKARMVVDH